MMIKRSVILSILFLAGCSATALTGMGAKVKEIDAGQATSCTFLQSFIVRTADPLISNPENDVRHRAMNRTDMLGGNAFLIENEAFMPAPLDAGNILEMRANAYQCPTA